MALIITLNSNRHYDWSLKEEMCMAQLGCGGDIYLIDFPIYNIQSIQADGDELEHIYKMFENSKVEYFLTGTHGNPQREYYDKVVRPSFIPKGKSPIIFGSLARTIVANLNYES